MITDMNDEMNTANDIHNNNHLNKYEKADHQWITSHSCEQCGKHLGSRRALKLHLLTHTGQRSHSCDQCDMSFSQTGTLANHKKFVHRQVRLFACNVCGSRSVTAQNLRKHSLIHTGANWRMLFLLFAMKYLYILKTTNI